MVKCKQRREESKNHLRVFSDVTVNNLMNNFSDFFLFMDTHTHTWFYVMESDSTFGYLTCFFPLRILPVSASAVSALQYTP